jgi:hypothetical protein
MFTLENMVILHFQKLFIRCYVKSLKTKYIEYVLRTVSKVFFYFEALTRMMEWKNTLKGHMWPMCHQFDSPALHEHI